MFAETFTNRQHKIGARKTSTDTQIRVDGVQMKRLSDVARITPLLILTPMSHEIFERGPEYRRRFMEWGMFHVEQNHFPLISRYASSLKQRNQCLRSSPETLKHWTNLLVDTGLELNEKRRAYVKDLQRLFKEEGEQLGLAEPLRVVLRPGWDESSTLESALSALLDSDKARGFTQSGPHRADLIFKFGDTNLKNTASRGQQKMALLALYLSQARMIRETIGEFPTVLLDDLIAELDKDNKKTALNRVRCLGLQAIISSTELIADSAEYADIRCYNINKGILTTVD